MRGVLDPQMWMSAVAYFSILAGLYSFGLFVRIFAIGHIETMTDRIAPHNHRRQRLCSRREPSTTMVRYSLCRGCILDRGRVLRLG